MHLRRNIQSISIPPMCMDTNPRTCSDQRAAPSPCPQTPSTGKFRKKKTELLYLLLTTGIKCAELTFSSTELRRRSTLTILDRSPTFDSNSRKRFHTSTDNCGVSPPDERTRSNSTRVLLSSVNDQKQSAQCRRIFETPAKMLPTIQVR